MASTYPGNYNYARDDLGIDPIKEPGRFEECIKAMEKYSTPWWYDHRADCAILANMQLREPVLLIRSNTFVSGIEKVIGRRIQRPDEEIRITNASLIEEFDVKYKEYCSK